MAVRGDAVLVQERVERCLRVVLHRDTRVAVRVHLEHELARLVQLLVRGHDVHTVRERRDARGHRRAAAFEAHEAHAAGAAVGEPVVLADRGHVCARGPHGVEDGGAVALDGAAIHVAVTARGGGRWGACQLIRADPHRFGHAIVQQRSQPL